MVYEMIGVIERTVVESFTADIEADSPSEAQDLFYEVLSEYPDSPYHVKRLLKVGEASSRPTSIAIEFARDELAPPEDDIDVVFSEGDNDDDS